MIDEIAAGLAKHKLVPFFGAGVSAPQSGVLWRDLIDGLADEIGLPPDERDNFLEVADRYVDAKGGGATGESALADYLKAGLILDTFDDVKGWAHLFLVSLNAGVLYTTNQDNQYELASSRKGRPHRVVARIEDLATSTPAERFLVKYHGDLAYPETVIFSGRSYEARIADVRHFLNIRMQADLLAKGFLFVGYSFHDPNIHLLFRELMAAFGRKLPPSYLIAYRYAPAMEDLKRDFGVNIVDPAVSFPGAASHDEAFKRYLASLSEKVLRLQTRQDLATILEPSLPMAARVATEFDVAAVVAEAATGDFEKGLTTYRALLDRVAIPEGLERDALEAFKRLCDAAQTEEDLGKLAGAIFNLGLPPGEGAEAISRFMVAVNRLNFSDRFPSYLVACPRYPDYVVPVAAAMAVTEIRDAGERVGDAFRIQADSWMTAYRKLPDHLQAQVKAAMEHAWRDAGQSIPRDLFDKSGPFAMRSFDDFMGEMRDRFPKFTKGPPN